MSISGGKKHSPVFTKVTLKTKHVVQMIFYLFVLVSVQRCFRKDCPAVPGHIGNVCKELHGHIHIITQAPVSLVLMLARWAIVQQSVVLAPSLPQRQTMLWSFLPQSEASKEEIGSQKSHRVLQLLLYTLQMVNGC